MNCPKCSLPRIEFGKIHKDGLCAPCRKERIKNYGKAWRVANRDYLLAEKKSDYRANKAHYNNLAKQWRKANPELKRKINREWKRARPELAYRWDKQNPDKITVIKNRCHLKRKYGITPEQAQQLFESQGKQCAICEKLLTLPNRATHLDHNHTTGLVRNYLCNRCNMLVGFIETTPDVVKIAQEYVSGWEEVQREPSIA